MKYLKVIALSLSLLLLSSCSFTGVGEKGEGEKKGEEVAVENPADPTIETPSGTAPGLYNSETGELKYSWAELEARGFITIKDNFLSKAVVYIRGDLYIPNSIAGIGNKAFGGCTGLTGVSIGNGATTIGDGAFTGCTGLIKADLGDGITNVGSKAFMNCTRLQGITVPDSVTNVGGSAFQGCTGLLEATIGKEVTTIGGSVFSGCTGLTKVTLNDKITYIAPNAFRNCAVLSRVKYNGKRSAWNSIYIDKKNDELLNATLITDDPAPTPVVTENVTTEPTPNN